MGVESTQVFIILCWKHVIIKNDKRIKTAGIRKTTKIHVLGVVYKGCLLCICNDDKHETFDSKLVC